MPAGIREDLHGRLENIIDVIISFDYVAGFCYSQCTDVEQEQNGIDTYERNAKFDLNIIRKIFRKEPEKYIKTDKTAGKQLKHLSRFTLPCKHVINQMKIKRKP